MTFLVGCIATRFLDWLIDGADDIGQEGVAKRKRWPLPDTPVRVGERLDSRMEAEHLRKYGGMARIQESKSRIQLDSETMHNPLNLLKISVQLESRIQPLWILQLRMIEPIIDPPPHPGRPRYSGFRPRGRHRYGGI